MNGARRQAIVETLWSNPGEDVYAVLDAARDPRVHRMVLDCGMKFACLYAGAVPPQLAEVAPYVVRLRPTSASTREILDAGWGQSWGFFATAQVDLEAVRRHLRRFLRVQREDGRTLVFRYYDPRVLRTYLPTCTPAELTTFFGPFGRLVVEDHDPARALVYSQAGGAFGMSKLVLDARSPAASPPP
jgi:hypothetical protein